MDPISAIGLASAIISFIDCAQKIVTGADELRNSVTGATEENSHTQTIITDLQEAAFDLTELSGRTKHERALNDLATKCKRVSSDLLRLLRKLTVSGNRSTWKVLKVAIRGLHKDGEVKRMGARLCEYRSEIILRLNLMLNDQQCSIKIQLDQLEDTALSKSTASAALLTKLREDILKDVSQLLENNKQDQPITIEDKVRDDNWEVQKSLKTLCSMMVTVPKENAILQSIFFNSMNDREQNMDRAMDGTFDWIFQEECTPCSQVKDGSEHSNNWLPSEGDKLLTESNVENSHLHSHSPTESSADDLPEAPEENKSDSCQNNEFLRRDWFERDVARTNFLKWLRFGGGIFHISGKAGSGKSTLMKFLCFHERTKQELQAWAGKRKLVFARFYFWKSSNNSNSPQNSLSGFHRSIVYETLKNCPDLIPQLFPRHWKLLNHGFPHVFGDFINDFEVGEAFEVLTAKGSFPQHRFCFFVDGLDEYNGHVVYQKDLAMDLHRWASGDDVKICASSRPYVQFDNITLSTDQKINLHLLTRHDIYVFSRKRIEASFKDNPKGVRGGYLHLVEKVVEKSEGVFLWARVVILSLVDGMLRHDTESVLEHKLDILPPDIDGLYTELLNTLSPDDRLRAEKMMLLAAHDPFLPTLSSVVYRFVDELENPDFPPRDGHKPASWESIEEMSNNVQLQLKSLTKGLLEIRPSRDHFGNLINKSSVKFFHRTLRDFVLENSKLSETRRQFPSLIEVETYHRLWLGELILLDPSARVKAWKVIYYNVLKGARFQKELTPDLLQRFSHIVEEEHNISDASSDDDTSSHGSVKEIFLRGVSCSSQGGYGYPKGKLLFASLAACTDQREYVLQQATNNPELLRGNGECHIMLSAALCGKTDLVRALLQRGSSPMDCVNCRDRGTGPRTIPLWIAFTMWLVGNCLNRSHVAGPMYEIWELLLEDERVDASTCNFLLQKADLRSDEITHFITLKKFIQDVKPHNVNQLLVLLDRGSKNSLVGVARWILSKFTPSKNIESVVDDETRGYTEISFDEESRQFRWWSRVAIFGDLRLYGPVTLKLY